MAVSWFPGRPLEQPLPFPHPEPQCTQLEHGGQDVSRVLGGEGRNVVVRT